MDLRVKSVYFNGQSSIGKTYRQKLNR